MNSKIFRTILYLSIATTISLGGFLLIDAIKGDNNGIIAGIPLIFITKFISIITFFYAFWYAFRKKIIWLQQVFIFIVMMVLTFAMLEWFFGILLAKNPVAHKVEGPSYATILDTNLGYKPAPDTTFVGKKIRDGKIVYEVSYKTDKNSLRIIPIDSSIRRTKYVQFHGCSFTWGEGLETTQTTSFYFQQLNTTFQPYNFGYSGYGPHEMLARFESPQVKNIVKEPAGIAFYIYIDDHVRRAISGTASTMNNGGSTPYYKEENGRLVRHKFFKDDRLITNFLYRIMIGSNICRYFSIGYPFKLAAKDYELTASIIAEAAKNYTNQFQNDNFYVIIYPSLENHAQIISFLKAKKIKVLDYSKLYDAKKPEYSIEFDGHPSAVGNELVVKQIQKDLAPILK